VSLFEYQSVCTVTVNHPNKAGLGAWSKKRAWLQAPRWLPMAVHPAVHSAADELPGWRGTGETGTCGAFDHEGSSRAAQLGLKKYPSSSGRRSGNVTDR
jgi:hypothetical protein